MKQILFVKKRAESIVIGVLLGSIVVFWSAFSAAQETSSSASQVPQEQQASLEQTLPEELSRAEVDDIITLLESETARTDFVNKLKAISTLKPEPMGQALSVSELLDLEQSSSELVARYNALLDALGMTDNQFGAMAVSVAMVLLLLICAKANSWLAALLDQRLNGLRRKFFLDARRLAMLSGWLRAVGYAIAFSLSYAGLAEIWSLSAMLPSGTLSYSGLLDLVLTFSLLIFLYVVVWELLNATIEYYLHSAGRMADERVDTMLPIIQKVIFFILAILFGLIALSELGLDIMPLLAGAGVFGIAIGFGAQTLVRDFLVGFIIIFEDLLQIGDVVQLGDRKGMVEKITIRKVQLRNLDGTVHTVPFSELSVVDNFTKEYSYYLMDIGVAYKEDIDQVNACISSVSKELRADKDFEQLILDDVDVLGVDSFADSAVIIKARIKTQAKAKWRVGREFNRRLKYAFDQQGIDIPFPHRTLYFANALAHSEAAGEAQ
ncbi:mechanosensitive ion channel family protein [Simiduia curdlanivorans]|uniref:Mechanosensitive ion channel family protein n=1 Tax=Simiduia curdlanivorans TaxID=1492769 RepID=A0ABV8V525_9GAMM|nr:mechanosensitive ion channel family protein [Simiduia curdlanivorans]MDN3641052.1 mechanosensitive ion channel family protein [Simiduia curdlanivorans]